MNLVRSAAVVYAPHGINVNAVCPGITETAMIHKAYAGVARVTGRDEDAALKDGNRRHPSRSHRPAGGRGRRRLVPAVAGRRVHHGSSPERLWR